MNRIIHYLIAYLRFAFSRHAAPCALLFLVVFVLVGAGQVCLGQNAEEAQNTVAGKGCDGINFQTEGYTVNTSRIDDPFDFLPWVRARERRAATEIKKQVDGKLFLYKTAVDRALEIIDNENFLPDKSDVPVRIRLEFVSVENCSDRSSSNRTLDLVYRVYSTQILPALTSAPEARVEERQSPQKTAGLTDVDVPSESPIHFTPTAGFDSTNKLSGGGRLEIKARRHGMFPFDSAIIEGQGSSKMRSISAALAGSRESQNWLRHSEWRLNFTNYSLPTDAGDISGGHLSAQYSGVTKAFAGGNVSARFGALLEGGNRQSDLRLVQLAPGTVANAGFGSLKLYTGLESRLRHNVFSFSYGLELGSVGPSARIDWLKHIADLKHELWYALGDHRTLDLESRFTIGSIQVRGKIPLAERFFGGNNEESLMPGDSWQIRANPVIRAIPGSRFYRTVDGSGGDSFFSYNLTAAYAVWRKPMVPSELSKDTEFNQLLQGQLAQATGVEELHYVTKDAHYLAVAKEVIPDPAISPMVPPISHVQKALADLQKAVTNQSPQTGQFPAQFDACTRAIKTANFRALSAAKEKDARQYALIAALLSADKKEDRLAKVYRACVQDDDPATNDALNEVLNNSDIATTGDNLNKLRQAMESEFILINRSAAKAQAEADMAFTRRTLNTLLKDLNIYSISPVFIFDVAKISPEKGKLGGLRYGPGAGLRLELASTVHFTVGYAWNIRQGPGEGSGTVFFSMGLRDLFH
ncbi:MAG: hypothetical protein QOJ02_2638 [Acidobacteriota bacterium]|nr:hypothetical protein [Acidobacteriota bacterium]